MTREMTNYEIIQVINKLDGMGNQVYPYKISRAIVKSLKSLREEYVIYEKSYKELLKTFYEIEANGNIKKDENDNIILKDPAKKETAIEEITNLLNEKITVELTSITPLELETIPTLSPADYMFFENYFIQEE